MTDIETLIAKQNKRSLWYEEDEHGGIRPIPYPPTDEWYANNKRRVALTYFWHSGNRKSYRMRYRRKCKGTPEQRKLWTTWRKAERERVVVREYARVSTVFLALDHSFTDGDPVLYETMIFAEGAHDGEQWRYTTRFDALAHHADVVNMLKAEGWKIKNTDPYLPHTTKHRRRNFKVRS